MVQLAISLLGSFNVSLNGNSLSTFATDKVRALLAYLAVESGRSHRRAALAGLFWPDRPEAMARNDLRQALFQLRKALGDRQDDRGFLTLAADDVQVNPASEHWLDVAEFNEHIDACRAHHPDDLSLCEACLARLERAVEVYQGEFLEGFSLPNCPSFDLWQVWTQEACHIRALEALTHLSNYYESRQRYEQVLEYSRRKIEMEPWRESAYRRMMRALAMIGQTGQALQQYEACREILRREFGIAPSQETFHLFEQIQNGRFDALNERESSAVFPWQPVAQPQEGSSIPPDQGEAPASHISSAEDPVASMIDEEAHLVEALDPAIPLSLRESNSRALLDLLSRVSFPKVSDVYQPFMDSLCTLALEIQRLHAGQILSAGRLHRLRKTLWEVISAFQASDHNLLVILGLQFITEIFTSTI